MQIKLQWPFSIVKEERKEGINTPGKFWDYVWPDDTKTVDADEALTLSAVYNALNILNNSVNIPVNVFVNEGNDRVPAGKQNELEWQVQYLLRKSPNRMHTPSQFYQLLETSKNIYGNGYAEIIRDRFGFPIALNWIHPDKINVKVGKIDLFYDILDESGKVIKNIPGRDMIHVKALSLNGYTGKSPIDLASESLLFGKNTQEQGNKYFEDGMTNKVVLSHPGALSADGQRNMHDSFEKTIKEKNTVVLEEGTKVYTLSITPEQSQFLGSREFSVTEVARWFNLPEWMLSNNAKSTFNNIEHQGLSFVTNNVRPLVRTYEQEFNWKLLNNSLTSFTEFNMDALIRADLAAQAEFFFKAAGGPWMTVDEVRKLKNLNAKGRDEILIPLNYSDKIETDEEQGNEGN